MKVKAVEYEGEETPKGQFTAIFTGWGMTWGELVAYQKERWDNIDFGKVANKDFWKKCTTCYRRAFGSLKRLYP